MVFFILTVYFKYAEDPVSYNNPPVREEKHSENRGLSVFGDSEDATIYSGNSVHFFGGDLYLTVNSVDVARRVATITIGAAGRPGKVIRNAPVGHSETIRGARAFSVRILRIKKCGGRSCVEASAQEL